MSLEGLGNSILDTILSRLHPRDAAAFACISSRCRALASDDLLWRIFCLRELDLEEPVDPDGALCTSFKEAYRRWQESFGMYPMALVRRTKRCWNEIKQWMAENFPEAGNTLQKGVSEVDIQEAEDELGVKLPLPTKLLYRFCNGQNTCDNVHAMKGIIGGYLFYDHLVNVHLLPLRLAVQETRNYTTTFASIGRKCVVVAISFYAKKLFFLDCVNGQLFVGTKDFLEKGEMLPCVPSELIILENGSTADVHQDALLLWLEEHARRLQDGRIRLRGIKKKNFICLFPELSPFCSIAVTNGVQVRASAVLVPELCDLSDSQEMFFFSYSIRMSLLPQGGLLDGVHFSSCQLLTRHWIIRVNEDVVSDVRGEAVIGKHPLLVAGKPEFVYESCTPLPLLPGSVEGSFAFVPGRIVSPEGRQFDVEVAPFCLDISGYIF